MTRPRRRARALPWRPQPSYARTVFLGARRSAAGLGICFSMWLMFFPLQWMAAELAGARDFGASGLWSMMLDEVGSLVAAVIPALVLMRVERRPWRRVWIAGKAGFWARVLGGHGVGICRDQPADACAVWSAHFLLWACRSARGSHGPVRGVLGGDVSAGRTV